MQERKLMELAEAAGNIAIVGHVRPDGDCVGSCLAVCNYITEQYPEKTVDVYLETPPAKFSYLKQFERICSDPDTGNQYDLCICLDSGDRERLLHDTNVFKNSNTTQRTMHVAGAMMAKGINFSRIIDESFYRKTYVQNQIMGRAVLESVLFLEGKCIFSVVRKQDMDFYGVEASDLDGIVDQLRITEGVEVAIFLYETENHVYKVSMRSNNLVNVSQVAAYFGGGGHVRAAGCTMSGSVHDVINNPSAQIDKQIKEHEA